MAESYTAPRWPICCQVFTGVSYLFGSAFGGNHRVTAMRRVPFSSMLNLILHLFLI